MYLNKKLRRLGKTQLVYILSLKNSSLMVGASRENLMTASLLHSF